VRIVVDYGTFHIDGVDVENSNDPSIQEWMIRIIVGFSQNHDVMMRSIWVNGVLFSVNVLCCIVDAKDIMKINAVMFE
jgi:hypothetical protein